MPISAEERRRRQAIDRNPANKCQWDRGCGNTARLGQHYCGTHLEQLEAASELASEFTSLHQRIYGLPEGEVRDILSDIVGRLEVLSNAC